MCTDIRASHVFSREVRARVVVNALVSTKTFRNATSPIAVWMKSRPLGVQQIFAAL
jgi:hypothetical protein